MRNAIRRSLLGVSMLACCWTLTAHAACNAQCLTKIMDAYLAQLPKHDPKPLPLAANVIARENSEAVKLGEGSWQSITKVYRGQTFADPANGEVAHYGAVDTNGKLGSLFLRLKVVDGKIVESELLTKGGEPGFSDDVSGLLEPDILYEATVPAARRSTREELIKIVNTYMDAISAHNGSLASFSNRCDRYSAGKKFTNSPDVPVERGGGTCAGSMNNLKGQMVVNRRFAVVDAERGVVCALFIIPHAERNPQNATNVAEFFKVVDGKIRSIEEFSFIGRFPPDSGFAARAL